MRIADHPGKLGDRPARLAQRLRGRYVEMRRAGTDADPRSVDLDTLDIGDMPEIDEIGRRRETLLHGGDQRHAAGQVFRLAGLPEQ
jgi:hypothetical protein